MRKIILLGNSNKRFLPHILLWLMYGLWSYSIALEFGDRGSFMKIHIAMFLMNGTIFYLNYLILVPKFYFKKKYLIYFGMIMTLLVVVMLIDHSLLKPLFEFDKVKYDLPRGGWLKRPEPSFIFRRFIPHLVGVAIFLLLSILLRVMEQSGKTEQKMTALKAEKYNAELKFLRSQINPHFLFNALNNIYSLVISKSEKAPDMLIRLSDMLRYLTYECNEEEVPIESEIKYLNNYIELQKLKDDEVKNISTYFQSSSLTISPMLLIPFVENAFKHSRIEDDKDSWIKIDLKIISDCMRFEVSNSLPKIDYKKDEQGGIGIDNVKKRLDLIYADKYDMVIEKRSNTYSVILKLRFS